MRSGTGSDITSLHPGMRNSAQCVRKLMFIGTSTGIVSATSSPPAAAAVLPASKLLRHALGHLRVDREHVPVQRTPRGDAHRGEELDLRVGEGVEATVDDALERRALVLAVAAQSARSSSRPAQRDATGFPSPSECV